MVSSVKTVKTHHVLKIMRQQLQTEILFKEKIVDFA